MATILRAGSSIVMGRKGVGVDILINHESVSGRHCVIDVHEDGSLSDNHLRATITDHSSNGTWVVPVSGGPSYRLVKGVATDIKVGDSIMLLNPRHCESHDCHMILERGAMRDTLVLRKTSSNVQRRKRSSLTEDEDIPVAKIRRVLENDRSDEEVIITSVTCPSVLTTPTITSSIIQSSNTRTGDRASVSSVPVPMIRDQSEEQCPKCLKVYNLSELISHCDTCTATIGDKTNGAEEKDQCEFCLKLFPLSELVYHGRVCSYMYVPAAANDCTDLTKDGVTQSEDIERCMKCFCDFPISELVKHSTTCDGEMLGTSIERFKDFLPSVHDVDAMALSVLTPTQQCAVDHVREQSRCEASDKYPDLCMRIIKLGYTPKDLQRVLLWVRNEAPIIIHLNLDRALHHLVKDTHYRNLFETHSSGGSTSFSGRKGWEDRMFNKIYHSSSPMDRVKYGVLNIVGDPAGVRCCYSYGDSFLQLKKVRLRTTFASMDTSSPSVKLSCCEHYGNVLHEYSNDELKAILEVATKKKPYMKSTVISHYKEVQIHGPVCLSENVDCIVVNHRHHGDKKIEELLEKFVEQNNCNLIWMDKHQEYD